MKNKILKALAVSGLAVVMSTAETQAQLSNNLYFDKNNYRARLANPANVWYGKFYLGLGISNIDFDLGVSNLTFTDIFKNGADKKTYLFCDKAVNTGSLDGIGDFLKAIDGKDQRIFSSFRYDFLDFGWKTKHGFLSFNFSVRNDTYCNIPEKIFTFAFEGMNTDPYTFGLSSTVANETVWAEFGLSFARYFLEDKLSVGVNLKYLSGLLNMTSDFKSLDITASKEKWVLNGDYTLYMAGCKATEKIDENGNRKIDDLDIELSTSGIFKNKGFAADLGVNYKLWKNLRVSASVLDLGFINWNDGVYILEGDQGYEFSGVKYNVPNNEFEELENFDASYKLSDKTKYKSNLIPKVYFGAEYGFWGDRIGIGIADKITFYENNKLNEIFANVNLRLLKKLTLNGYYSLAGETSSNIGAGVNFVLGCFNFFTAVDNVSMKYAALEGGGRIPVNTSFFRINFGFGISIKGRVKKEKGADFEISYDVVKTFADSDGDGVVDSLDQCGNTPEGVDVDSNGCPLDDDGDGVANYLDKCPGTPSGESVDADGCPLDSDGDGVPDKNDRCPNTPFGLSVDQYGCPADSDGDGVPDHKDRCNDTPAGVKTDANGCPLDSDGDGVPDHLDKCPDINGSNNGCPEIKEEVKKVFKKALNSIQFETGNATILLASYPVLDEIVNIMKENPDYKLKISGHTDNNGTPESNMKLSKDRANAVKSYLVINGVSSRRITAQGFGDTKPVGDNNTEAGRAQNRRVEFEAEY